MFPAQTSFIPVSIALARYLEQGGSIGDNYPYWYLGTTPYRYLTGPVIPWLLTTLHKIFPLLSLFDLMFFLIAAFFLLGGVGWYCLVKSFQQKEKQLPPKTAWLAAFFYLAGWLVPCLFPFSDGQHLIALSLLPYFLLTYRYFLRQPGFFTAGAAVGLGALILLVDSTATASIIVGLTAVFLSVADTWTIPLASISKVTSICGTPLRAGAMPTNSNRPRVLLSAAISLSPCSTWMETAG